MINIKQIRQSKGWEKTGKPKDLSESNKKTGHNRVDQKTVKTEPKPNQIVQIRFRFTLTKTNWTEPHYRNLYSRTKGDLSDEKCEFNPRGVRVSVQTEMFTSHQNADWWSKTRAPFAWRFAFLLVELKFEAQFEHPGLQIVSHEFQYKGTWFWERLREWKRQE